MTSSSAGASKQGRQELRAILIFVLFFAVGVLRYLPIIDAPWDDSLTATNGWAYAQPIARNFERIGFVESGGQPYLVALPGPDGIPAKGVLPYTNHPPGLQWAFFAATRYFGTEERGLRVIPILCSAVALGLIAVFGFRIFSWSGALFSGILYAVTPLSFAFGWITSSESVLSAFFALALFAHRSLRAKGVRSYWPVHLLVFFAVQMDWQGVFILPMLFAYEALIQGGNRRIRRCASLMISAALGIAVSLSIFISTLGGVSEAVTVILGTFFKVARVDSSSHFPETLLFSALATTLVDLVGWPILIASGLGCLLAIVSFRSPLSRLVLVSFIPGTLNILLFRRHAVIHDFWCHALAFPLLLCATLTIARAGALVLHLERRCRWLRRALPALFLLVLLALSIDGVLRFRSYRERVNSVLGRDYTERTVAIINQIIPQGSVLLLPHPIGREMARVDCTMISVGESFEKLDKIYSHWAEGDIGSARVYYGRDSASLQSDRALVEWLQKHAVRAFDLPHYQIYRLEKPVSTFPGDRK